MKEHLNDSQIAELVSGGSSNTSKQHLDACILCRAEVEELRGALTGLRQSIHEAAAARSFAWRAPVLGSSEDAADTWAFGHAPEFKRWRLAQAAALTTLVLVCSLFLTFGSRLRREPGGVPVEPSARSIKGTDLSDEALLIDVQTDIREQVPAALAPAELIAEERDRVVQAQSTKRTR